MSTPEPARKNEYRRAKTGRLVPCPGDAHKNAYIDNCGTCAPRWGEVEELAPVDIEAARKAKQDIPCSMPNRDQYAELDALCRDGVCAVVSVVRKARGHTTYYFVFRWL